MANLMIETGVQETYCKIQTVAAASTDVAAGGVVTFMRLPSKAIVMSMNVVTDTAFDAATTLIVLRKSSVDDSTLETMLNGVAVSAAGVDAYTFTGLEPAPASYLTWDTNQAVTVGSARVIVEYVVNGREKASYG